MSVELLLCVRHATQVAGNLEVPTHACFPKPQWMGDDLIMHECDARYGSTPKILEYLLQEAQTRGKTL